MIAQARTLQLYGSSDDSDSFVGLTLREAFASYKLATLKNRSTIDDYRSFLAQWERLTSDPDVGEIDDVLCADYVAAREAEGKSAQTINGNRRCFRSIINAIGPRTGERPTAELIERKPYMPKADGERVKPLRVVPRASLLNWLNCLFVVSPAFSDTRRIPGPLLFRSMIAVVLGTGLRMGDVESLTWSRFTADECCPGDDHYRHPFGWFDTRDRKTQKPNFIPLPQFVRVHIDALAACNRPRAEARILPFNGSSVDGIRKRRDALRTLSQEHAGIDKPYGMHDLRATCGQWWDHARPGCGELILNHAPRSVTDRFYLGNVPRLLDAVDRLDVPAELLKTE